MAADDLVTQGAKASAAKVLTTFSQYIPVSAPEELTYRFSKCLAWTEDMITLTPYGVNAFEELMISNEKAIYCIMS